VKYWQEILQRLRNGEDIAQVRKDYRSASEFTKALNVYCDEMVEKTRKIFSDYNTLSNLLSEAKTTFSACETENREIEKSIEQNKHQAEMEQNKVSDLAAQKETLTKELNQLRTDVEGFERRGFTQDVLGLIKTACIQDFDELKQIIADKNKVTQLREEKAALEEEKANLQNSIDTYNKKVQSFKKKHQLHLRQIEEDRIQEEYAKERKRSYQQAAIELSKQITNQTEAHKELVHLGKTSILQVTDLVNESIKQTIAELSEKTNQIVEALALIKQEQYKVELEKQRLVQIRSLYELEYGQELPTLKTETILLILEKISIWLNTTYPQLGIVVSYDFISNTFQQMQWGIGPKTQLSAYLEIVIRSIRKQIEEQQTFNRTPDNR
jgi:chromosome segregation ATPase